MLKDGFVTPSMIFGERWAWWDEGVVPVITASCVFTHMGKGGKKRAGQSYVHAEKMLKLHFDAAGNTGSESLRPDFLVPG